MYELNDKMILSSNETPIGSKIFCYDHENIKLYYEKENLQAIKNYKKLINLVARLVRELSIEDNSISASFIISRLIYNGYISPTGYFTFDGKGKYKDILSYEGMDLATGRGCCRHIASFYKDVFDVLKMKNTVISAIVTDEKKSLVDIYEEKAGHATNIISYDDVMYLSDLTSNWLYFFENSFLAKPLYANGKMMYFKPASTMFFYGISKEDMLKMLTKLNQNSKNQPISCKEYFEIKVETEERFLSKRATYLLSDFKWNSKKYIKRISKELNN